jgi:DNA topoisomerase-2
VLFHPDDDHVLEYLEEEGLSIEPKWYCPTLPNVLVNGADGIGVGWSTNIPNYNPREIIANIRKLLRGMAMTDMHPWFKGFMGSIEPNPTEPGRYEVTGVIRKRNDTTIEITELPIKSWTQNYKEFLEELMPKDSKKGEETDHTIEDFKEYHTESSVHFVLTLTPQKMREVEQFGLEKKFKLKTSLATSNMVLFDAEGKIARYNTALDILREFCKLRRKVYVARKSYLVAKLTRETEILSNKARFILMVVKGELELRKKKKAVLLQELKDLKFTPMSQLDAIMKGKTALNAPQEAEASTTTDGPTEKSEYDYLLNMNLWSLTFEKVEEIKKQLETKKEELQVLQGTTEETMWDRDLEALSAALDELDRIEEDEALAGERALEGRKRKRGRAAMPPPMPVIKPAQRTPATSSSAWLKQPLVDCSKSLDGEVIKTVWGTGEDQMLQPPAASLGQQRAKVRGLRPEAESAAPSVAPLGQRAGPGRRPRPH